ncbi:LysR family transcriptional regulator [Paraburkholderia acidipaludis]|uniref:LysR family transcriptional regulator n=1 Tax=Paraburkholderia acidipaludis TaxID=660537 RepID=UPI000486FD4E|nr:LysR substrate-binding domain-containing protein [Paraburkholderia acidipaludis]
MELRQLQYFLKIAEAGTLSRAAILLSIGQPVLTRQIKALEEEMGTPLLHRTGRGVTLTEAGRILEQQARRVVDTLHDTEVEIRMLRVSPAGRVVIGMPPSVAAVLTTPLVQQFRHELPDAALGVVEGFSGHVLDWLMTGAIDVAILYNAPRLRALATDPLLTDEIFLLGPASDPAGVGDGAVAAKRLADLPMILPSRPHSLRVMLDRVLAKADLAANPKLEINAMPSTLHLVEAGFGYTILSYSCVHQLVVDGRIRCWRIVQPTMTRSLVMATSTQRPVTRVARMLMRMAHRQIERLIDDGHWSPTGI